MAAAATGEEEGRARSERQRRRSELILTRHVRRCPWAAVRVPVSRGAAAAAAAAR